MSFFAWLRNLIEGPPHISGGGDGAEAEDDLDEEMSDAAEDVDSVVRAEGGRVRIRSAERKFQPDIGPFEAAEHEDDDSEPEASPDGNS